MIYAPYFDDDIKNAKKRNDEEKYVKRTTIRRTDGEGEEESAVAYKL